MNNRQVLLARRPVGLPQEADFTYSVSSIPRLASTGVLVQNLFCSLDPAMRRWLDEQNYASSVPLDDVVQAINFSRVVASADPQFECGDYLIARAGVEDYSIVYPDAFTQKVGPLAGVPLYRYLSTLGLTGMTAYFALLELGCPAAGETLLVSSAAGAVGALVGQIGKIKGCRVVGIAGGKDKCQRLVHELGFDAAIDYKGSSLPDLVGKINNACPNGVDIYFDNVGGLILDAALACINQNARLVECGMISHYNAENAPHPISNIWQIVAKTATMRGFLGRYYTDHFHEAIADLSAWSDAGRIVSQEHIEYGLENFYSSFMRLFDGSNRGKLILQVAEV